MTRQNIMLAGVAAIVAIIAGGLMLGVLPQHRAAVEADAKKAELTQSNTLLTVRLAALSKQKSDMDTLTKKIDVLRSQIPATADLASVTRVIVKALQGPGGSDDVTLVSITPQVPPVPFTPKEQLTPDIGVAEVPTLAPPASGVPTPVPAGTFQEIPLMITATAPNMRAAFRFVDLLNNGPRLLAVHHVDIATGEATPATDGGKPSNAITISVVGAAYLKPRAVDPVPAPAP